MPLNTDKFAVPDGAPAGGVQKMKSVTWGELAGLLANANYSQPTVDGSDGDVITTDGAGVATFKTIPRAGTLSYRFNTSITSPTASGQVRLNNATQDSATSLFMDDTTFNGSDVSAFLGEVIQPGSIIRLQRQEDAGQFKDFDVVSIIDQGTFHDVVVTFRASGGADFGNNNNLLVTFLSGTSQASSFSTETSTTTLSSKKTSARYFKCDATGGAFTLTLPPSAEVSGLGFIFTKTDTGNNKVTVDGNGAELIGGKSEVTIDGFEDSFLLIADGIGWIIASTQSRIVGFLSDRDGQSQQSIPTGVSTQVELNQEQIDVGEYYDNTTFEWTPQAGIYIIQVNAKILQMDSNDEAIVSIFKNSVVIYSGSTFSTMNNQDVSVNAIGLTQANGTDVYTMEVEHDQGGALNLSSLPNETYMYGFRLG